MKTFFLSIFLVMIVLGTIVNAQEQKLIIRAGDFPPYYFTNSDNEITGLEIEVLKAVLKEAKISSYKFVEMTWPVAIKSIKFGKIDIMLSLTKLPEREKFIDYIGVSRYEQTVLVVAKDNINIDIKSIDDLKKFTKQFGIRYKVYYPKLSEKLQKDTVLQKHIKAVIDSNVNAKKTVYGSIMGFFSDLSSAVYKIKHNPLYKGLAIHSFSLSEPKPVYIGASRKLSKEYRDKLKTAYLSINKKGKVKDIIDKWNKGEI